MYSIYDVEGPYWNCKTDSLIRQIDENLKGGQIMAGIKNDVIDTGYIPVEYNMYLTLTEKAEKYDRMMGALKEYNNKHKNSISDPIIFESTWDGVNDAFYRLNEIIKRRTQNDET